MKTKAIMVRFLDTYSGTSISSHTLQLAIPEFALKVYGKYVNPETVSREWRKLRDDKKYLEQNGYSIIEDMLNKSREKKFIIRRLSEVHRDSSKGSKEQRDDNPTDRSEKTITA